MILETYTPGADLSLLLRDQTSHYFGGYYHVKVCASCDIPLLRSYFDDDAAYSLAVGKLGTHVRFERTLEKMAVPASAVESVRTQLIREFKETAGAYLATPDFAPRFVRSEYQKCLQSSLKRASRA